MPLIRFTRPRNFGGVDYPASTVAQSVPAEAIKADQWFYDACVEDGSITPVQALDGKPAKK